MVAQIRRPARSRPGWGLLAVPHLRTGDLAQNDLVPSRNPNGSCDMLLPHEPESSSESGAGQLLGSITVMIAVSGYRGPARARKDAP